MKEPAPEIRRLCPIRNYRGECGCAIAWRLEEVKCKSISCPLGEEEVKEIIKIARQKTASGRWRNNR
jgi:hypothetical protein